MAYYDGETLKERIERGPLPVEDALDIAIQMAQALARAHESGIVHRDIKPANLMIAKDGLVKILDFGLAKLAGRSDLTRTGTTLGTVAYMSPGTDSRRRRGCARGRLVARRRALRDAPGRRPFEGKDRPRRGERHSPPGARTGRLTGARGLPRALSKSSRERLDKNVASRYRSATELLQDLVACRTAMTRTAPQGAGVLRLLLRGPSSADPVAPLLMAAGVLGVVAFRRSRPRAMGAADGHSRRSGGWSAPTGFVESVRAREAGRRRFRTIRALASLWPQFSVLGSARHDRRMAAGRLHAAIRRH